jgi:large subunit ribosomal protein L13
MSGRIRVAKSVQTISFSLRHQDVKKKWIIVDADGAILGRLAASIATILRGKHRPTFSPSVDCGDNVIVINADKVQMTGRKMDEKEFHYHTGHPGGIKTRTRGQILASAHPERVIEKAVERMLPKGPLGRRQLGNMKVYAGTEHPHAAQSPTVFDFGAVNSKNKKRG